MPLKVLPSITKPPPASVARAEVDVAQPALPAAVAPLGGEHDEVERVRRLDLEPARPAASRLVRSVERLHHHALVAVRERLARGTAPPRRRPRSRCEARAALRGSARRERANRSRQDGRARPRRRGGAGRRRRARAARRRVTPPRQAGGRTGASSPGTGAADRRSSSAITSPSRIAALEREPTQRVHDLRHAVRHVGKVPRIGADLVALARAPGAGHRRASTPRRPRRDARTRTRCRSAGCASIGWIGRSSFSRNSASPSLPDVSAAVATAPRSPASISARRTTVAGRSAAFATASAISACNAPWRSSPVRRRARNCCSGSVAREKRLVSSSRRAACEPGPVVAPILRKAASTSSTPSTGGGACSGGRSRSAAQPMPIGGCGNSPERYATVTGTSSGSRRVSTLASASIFFRRARVDATSAETSTSSIQ